MITIPVRVCGDHWVNPDEVKQQLEKIAGKDTVILDLQSEGPSLYSLGIADTIDDYCQKYQISAKNIYVENWSNRAEPVDYTIVNAHDISHFFSYSKNYWIDNVPESTHQNTFGYFIGRRSIPRAVIMYQLNHTYSSGILFSCLKNKSDMPWIHPGSQVEKLQDWLTQSQQKDFCSWWETDPINSIDNHFFEDSYNTTMNTNVDLLKFYQDFDIELVSESYTRGSSFFPTEKTVRPLMAAKPMIVYGPSRYLQRLRMLGFKTYSSLWDEKYDQFEGPARWEAMRLVIDSIMTLYSEDRLSIIAEAQEIANYNRQHLASLINI